MSETNRAAAPGADRSGFTLIETVVVLGVLGILFALTTAAIQSAREAARRMQCSNNLRQIGLALQNYVTEVGCFPPIDCASFRPGMPAAHYYSVLSRTLSLVDNLPLYNSVNFYFVPVYTDGLAANRTAMLSRVALFLCPSDPGGAVDGYGRTNYRFNVGATCRFAPGPSDPPSLAGAFTTHFAYSPAAFTDGLSNTVGISERLQGDWLKSTFKQGGDYSLSPFGGAVEILSADQAVTLCDSVPAGYAVESRGGESWFVSGFHFTNYNHLLPPNGKSTACAFDDLVEPFAIRVIHAGVFPATSYHKGGVMAATMDGSVRFVADGIAPTLWRALATRAGGEVVNPID
jgi:prepilin-type N-terminal cleavage/methylation domain-containing protein